MTVTNPVNSVSLIGNGVTTNFPFTFLIPAGTAQVTLTDLITGLEGSPLDPSDYTVNGEDDPNGGSVDYDPGTPIDSNTKINIKRILTPEQPLDLTSQSAYNPENLEDVLDSIVMLIIQLNEQINRAVKIGTGTSTSPEDLVSTILEAVQDAANSASTATEQAAIATAAAEEAATFDPDSYVPKTGGAFTGDVTVTTQTEGNNSTKIATTAFVQTAVKHKTEVLVIAVSDESTALTTGTAKVTFRMPYAFHLTAVRASLTTVSSSGNPTFDINEAGTSILGTNKLSIDANEKTSTTAATPTSISDADLADDAEITIDIDTAGTGAKGAKVYLIGHQT